MNTIPESDLILNPDGSVYHLNLLPEDIADTIITVGDPDRVEEVSKYFDEIELRKGKREFITHTGYVGKKRLSVISTGIGTDNIDIVINELDSLVNINLATRTVKTDITSLNIIRIGTSGSLQSDIPIDSIICSSYGLGMDALMHYYSYVSDVNSKKIQTDIKSLLADELPSIEPYIFPASKRLLQLFPENVGGITLTAPGFYGPQGRLVRTPLTSAKFLKTLSGYRKDDLRITNLEMETAGIYALSSVLGHHALSVNAILAHRLELKFSDNPQKIIERAISTVLDKLVSS